MLTSLQGVALFDFEHMPFQIHFIKLLEHREGFFVANNGQARITPQQFGNGVAVIGLDMVDHQVVQVATIQSGSQVLPELLDDGVVNAVSKTVFSSKSR